MAKQPAGRPSPPPPGGAGAAPTAPPTCAACRHFEPAAEAYGRCRRFPPTIVNPADLTPDGSVCLWPLVAPQSRCGEFAAR